MTFKLAVFSLLCFLVFVASVYIVYECDATLMSRIYRKVFVRRSAHAIFSVFTSFYETTLRISHTQISNLTPADGWVSLFYFTVAVEAYCTMVTANLFMFAEGTRQGLAMPLLGLLLLLTHTVCPVTMTLPIFLVLCHAPLGTGAKLLLPTDRTSPRTLVVAVLYAVVSVACLAGVTFGPMRYFSRIVFFHTVGTPVLCGAVILATYYRRLSPLPLQFSRHAYNVYLGWLLVVLLVVGAGRINLIRNTEYRNGQGYGASYSYYESPLDYNGGGVTRVMEHAQAFVENALPLYFEMWLSNVWNAVGVRPSHVLQYFLLNLFLAAYAVLDSTAFLSRAFYATLIVVSGPVGFAAYLVSREERVVSLQRSTPREGSQPRDGRLLSSLGHVALFLAVPLIAAYYTDILRKRVQ